MAKSKEIKSPIPHYSSTKIYIDDRLYTLIPNNPCPNGAGRCINLGNGYNAYIDDEYYPPRLYKNGKEISRAK